MNAKETQKADPSKRSRRGKRIFSGLVIAMVCVWGVALTVLRHDTMVDHATLVTPWRSHPNAPAKSLPEWDDYVLDHHWTADGALLRVPFTIPDPFRGSQATTTTLEKLDPTSGSILSTKAVSLHSVQRSTLNEPSLSPDSKWLLMEDAGDIAVVNTDTGAVRSLPRGGFGKDCPVILAMLKQGQIMTTETSLPGVKGKFRMMHPPYLSLADRVAWARDSRSFFEMKQSKTAPYFLQQRTLDDRIVLDFPLKGVAGNTGTPQMLGQTRTGEILLIDRASNYVSTLLFVDPKTGQIRMVPIKELPQGLLIKQVELSPDGARLLWKTVNVNPSPVEALSLAASQLAKNPLRFQVSIKVSDIEGAHIHDIAGERMSATEEDRFQTVHWLPDSKRVSFWYKASLYTLPAP